MSDLETTIRALVAEEVARQLATLELAGHDRGSPWLSLAEAADYLRVSERQVQRLVARGKVNSTTVGRRRLVRRGDLDKAATGEEAGATAPSRRREA